MPVLRIDDLDEQAVYEMSKGYAGSSNALEELHDEYLLFLNYIETSIYLNTYSQIGKFEYPDFAKREQIRIYNQRFSR